MPQGKTHWQVSDRAENLVIPTVFDENWENFHEEKMYKLLIFRNSGLH
jgi:hypothetical protein